MTILVDELSLKIRTRLLRIVNHPVETGQMVFDRFLVQGGVQAS
jgi:hypothetical protein